MTIQPSLMLTDISANSSTPSNSLAGLFKNLREAKTAAAILQTGVETVYQALKCDRAVVYSLQSDSYCQIIAEAVTPGYTQILGTTIQDPCFETNYIEKYSRGRVKATTDIYQSQIAPCHIKTLEKIEVKSNLVVPIIKPDDSLYGLLVIHQCSTTREWQQPEIELVLEVSTWLIDQLIYRQAYETVESQLAATKKARQLMTTATQKIHQAATNQEVLQQGVLQAQEIINCDRVVVYGLQEPNMGKIIAESAASALAPILGQVIKDPCFEYRYRDQYQQGRIRAIPDIFDAGMTDCYVENLARIGVKSNLVAPINWDNGEIYGLLVAHQCFDFKDWTPAEIENFQEIAIHTGLSLSKATIQEQHHKIATGINQLSQVKDTVNLAKSKIDEVTKPMENTGKMLVEINNLNKLLEREFEQINQNSSLQTKKDTKLIQIIARKLVILMSKLRSSLSMVNTSNEEVNLFLDEAIAHLDGDTSKFD